MEIKNLELILEHINNSRSVILIIGEQNLNEFQNLIKEKYFSKNTLFPRIDEYCSMYVDSVLNRTEFMFDTTLIEQDIMILEKFQFLVGKENFQRKFVEIIERRNKPTIIFLNKEFYSTNLFIPEIEKIFYESISFEFVVNGNFGIVSPCSKLKNSLIN